MDTYVNMCYCASVRGVQGRPLDGACERHGKWLKAGGGVQGMPLESRLWCMPNEAPSSVGLAISAPYPSPDRTACIANEAHYSVGLYVPQVLVLVAGATGQVT